MALWHLEELENGIYATGWKINKRLEVDGYRYSGIWEIERGSIQNILFNGFNDLEVLPMNKAYACTIEGTELNIYFYKKGKEWREEFEKFKSFLNNLE